MHFYAFHLMPWPYLPDDFAATHDTAWVVCENDLYDPNRGHEVYNRYLDELELADQLGFDGICLNEHHRNTYGMMPSPNIMAARWRVAPVDPNWSSWAPCSRWATTGTTVTSG